MSPMRRRNQSSETETKEERKYRLFVQTAARIDDQITIAETKYINRNLRFITRIEDLEAKRDKLMERAKKAKRANRSNGMLCDVIFISVGMYYSENRTV